MVRTALLGALVLALALWSTHAKNVDAKVKTDVSVPHEDLRDDLDTYFQQMDANKDGFVTRPELTNWLRAHHHSEEQELNEHDYNVFFQELDLNKDRRISQSEMHSDVLQADHDDEFEDVPARDSLEDELDARAREREVTGGLGNTEEEPEDDWEDSTDDTIEGE